MKRALQVIKSVLAVIGLFALGILTGALFFRRPSEKDENGIAEKAREDKKNEIESTPADALVSGADNAAELGRIRDKIKTDFRERVRNRLDAELLRLGRDGDALDCGERSGAGG